MVRGRKLVWQQTAQKDRKEILKYWNNRNKSKNYSKKLNKLFVEKIRLLKDFPLSGRLTNQENVRILIVESYLIVYEIFQEAILISRIWDGRRDSEKFQV